MESWEKRRKWIRGMWTPHVKVNSRDSPAPNGTKSFPSPRKRVRSEFLPRFIPGKRQKAVKVGKGIWVISADPQLSCLSHSPSLARSHRLHQSHSPRLSRRHTTLLLFLALQCGNELPDPQEKSQQEYRKTETSREELKEPEPGQDKRVHNPQPYTNS